MKLWQIIYKLNTNDFWFFLNGKSEHIDGDAEGSYARIRKYFEMSIEYIEPGNNCLHIHLK